LAEIHNSQATKKSQLQQPRERHPHYRNQPAPDLTETPETTATMADLAQVLGAKKKPREP